jgi:acetyl-CoA carboxylase carboxyl transferase subunit alpha
MKGFGLVDDIIPEPAGGAHWDYAGSAEILKDYLIKVLQELKPIPPAERMNKRIEKFGKMGFWEEVAGGNGVSHGENEKADPVSPS